MGELKLDRFKRVNESVSPELLQDDELVSLQNMILDSNTFQPIKRNGFTRFNSNPVDLTPESPLNMFDIVDAAGSNYLLVQNTKGKIFRSLNGTGAWTSVKSGLDTSNKCRMSAYNSAFYFTNGVDKPFILSDAGLATNNNMEIVRPDVSGIGISATAGAGSLSVGNYRWILVYITKTGEVSNISLPFTIFQGNGVDNQTCTVVNDRMDFTNLPVSSDSRVTGRKLYRTKANDTTFYLVASLDNTATTYQDGLADSSLDTSDTITLINIPTKAKYISLHRSRIFLANITKTLTNQVFPPAFVKNLTITQGTTGVTALGTGTYMWKFSFLDNQGYESDPTPAFSTTFPSGTTNKATFKGIPIPRVGAGNVYQNIVSIRMYRTAANGSTYYWDQDFSYQEVTNANFLPTDTLTDTILITQGQYPKSGNSTSSTINLSSSIVFSEVNQPSIIPELNIMPIFPDDGDEITGIFDDTNGLLIFKRKSICKLFTSENSTNWQLYKISENIGSEVPDSIYKNGDEYFFSSIGRGYIYKNNNLEYISELFKTTFASITFLQVIYSVALQWYVIAGTISGSYFLIIYDTKIKTWYKFSINDVRCIVEKKYGSSIGTLLLGVNVVNVDSNSYVVQYDKTVFQDTQTGTTTDITATLKTKTFGDLISLIRLRHFFINYTTMVTTSPSDSTSFIITNADSGTTQTGSESLNSNTVSSKRYVVDGFSGTAGLYNKFNLTISGTPFKKLSAIKIGFRTKRRGMTVER